MSGTMTGMDNTKTKEGKEGRGRRRVGDQVVIRGK